MQGDVRHGPPKSQTKPFGEPRHSSFSKISRWRAANTLVALPSLNCSGALWLVVASQASAVLETETSIELNLTPGAHRGEYSADVVREIAHWIFENGVSIPSQSERTLRVAWDCKIRMIE
jgi:hypothetical protein